MRIQFLATAMLLSLASMSQTIRQEKGLTTLEYKLTEGLVKVYLPSDIRAGDVITGTFFIEPSGSNARQRQRSLEDILKKQISLGDGITSRPLQQLYKPDANMGIMSNLRVPERLMINMDGQSTQINMVPVEPGVSTCQVPSHANTGMPLRIRGNFDGDATNTRLSVNNKPAQILAESPRQSIIVFPADGKGSQTISVMENGNQQCEQPVTGVDMQLSAGKLDLMRGESTYIDILITGLENLPEMATLKVDNLTADVVTMVGGNHHVIPIMPDSAGASYNRRFNVQSIRTGSFAVNVNLDLPEVYSTVNDSVPPGYVKKKCACSVENAKITRSGGTPTSGIFKVEGTPQCTGPHGIGIATFERCSVRGVTYAWEIVEGKENASVPSDANKESASVRSSTNATYKVCATIIVTCNDGTKCETKVCADQTGKPVDIGPTITRPPNEDPPPPRDPKRCRCTTNPVINAAGAAGGVFAFNVNVNAACTGSFGEGASQQRCGVQAVTYNWSIGAGMGIASIPGPKNGAAVSVRTTGMGKFTLNVNGIATCNDGTICEYTSTIDVDVDSPKVKACNVMIEEQVDPLMDGGLKAGYAKTYTINRDEFIALSAAGMDYDKIKWKCEPTSDCEDQGSEKNLSLNGRVRFEWLMNGEGGFVKLGCLPDMAKNDVGDNIIFKPPFIPLPVIARDTIVKTSITLTVIDDNPTQPLDPNKISNIEIITKRMKNKPDVYEIVVTTDHAYNGGPRRPAEDSTIGTCKPQKPEWTSDRDLSQPTISLPTVPDNDKMVRGQWIILTVDDQRDVDSVKFICKSEKECPTTPQPKAYEDNVTWHWDIVSGPGRFVGDKIGRYVIYEADSARTQDDMHEVTIKVTAKNSVAGKTKDRDSPDGQITLKIYKPGVQLSHPPVTWLPEEANLVRITSSLKYKDGTWKDALAHMCRIHYFEFIEVSNETGVTMNFPEPKNAEKCIDMAFQTENEHEAFDERKPTDCKIRGMFVQARTQKPVINYEIIIQSKDYGGYSLVRSFANVNKGGDDGIGRANPRYHSIPVLRSDVTHPDGRRKKNEYGDNRVTVPMDIDENRIPDAGWTAFGGGTMDDPVLNNTDEDQIPAGDGFPGDGLTTYQEYRGFKVSDGGIVSHIRTDTSTKDIFVKKPRNFNLNAYASVSGLHVHEISSNQYVDDRTRVVNPNSNPAMHLFYQKGLKIVDAGNHTEILGVAESETGEPAIPNLMREIRIYTGKITSVSRRKGLNFADKLSKTIAHELLHANNVCHHGEEDKVNKTVDNAQGLRSGDTSCVMRYDNVGTTIRGYDPEAIGVRLCTDAAGNGYNANGRNFGNAAPLRGNCSGMIRISGRLTTLSSCGNRKN